MYDFKLGKLPLEMNALFNWACPVVFSLIVSFVVSGTDLWRKVSLVKKFQELTIAYLVQMELSFCTNFQFRQKFYLKRVRMTF